MRYMLLYCDDESREGESEEEMMAAWMAYEQALVAAGVWQSGNALQPTVTASVVRSVDGEMTTTDGPFAETKESLGGYDIIDVADLDEAIAWAERCPVHPDGLVEVRPVLELPEEFG